MNKKTSSIIALLIIAAAAIIFAGTASSGPKKAVDQTVSQAKKNNIEKTFPEFTITDTEGKEFTRGSFAGKPAIIWFTTSWCVPCQIGAEKVAKLDDELGGGAFDVLVVFVDARESADDLRKWKEQFGNDDWIVAFDNPSDPLAQKINLKYLDTKYMLDENGLVRDIDLKIADGKYLELVKSIVNKN